MWSIPNTGQLPNDLASGPTYYTGTTKEILEPEEVLAATKKLSVVTSFPTVSPFCIHFCTDLYCHKTIQTDTLEFALYSKTYTSFGKSSSVILEFPIEMSTIPHRII